MAAPSACNTGTRQLFTSSPFMRTEQEPHSPSPQPSLVPVKCRSSRSTSSRRFIGGALTVRDSPLTLNLIAGHRWLKVAPSPLLIAPPSLALRRVPRRDLREEGES